MLLGLSCAMDFTRASSIWTTTTTKALLSVAQSDITLKMSSQMLFSRRSVVHHQVRQSTQVRRLASYLQKSDQLAFKN